MLAYFRSQHPDHSWLGTLTVIVDASAVLALSGGGSVRRQAEVTFRIGSHVISDLATVFAVPVERDQDRLPHDAFERMQRALSYSVPEPELDRLRLSYEPQALALARHFLMALLSWVSPRDDDSENAKVAVSDPFRQPQH